VRFGASSRGQRHPCPSAQGPQDGAPLTFWAGGQHLCVPRRPPGSHSTVQGCGQELCLQRSALRSCLEPFSHLLLCLETRQIKPALATAGSQSAASCGHEPRLAGLLASVRLFTAQNAPKCRFVDKIQVEWKPYLKI
jgi:hypothetical protein